MVNTLFDRTGQPSPLIFHLSSAAVAYHKAMASQTATPDTNDWHPELRAEAAQLGDLNQLELYKTAVARLRSLATGLRKWQSHPFRRTPNDPPVVWSDGSSRLLDYGTCPDAVNPQGPPVLVIPSMINQSYILDLDENSSLLRFMAGQGLRPLLLDWGSPTDTERHFDLNTYVTKRFLPALNIARSLSNAPVGVLGYCMGGTLAAGVISQYPTDVGAFATIGSPWDFSASTGNVAAMRTAGAQNKAAEFVEVTCDTFGMFPAEFLQYMFATINPIQASVKFRKFNEMPMDSPTATKFVAIEDWLADGVPLVTECAKNLLIDWNIHNSTASGTWKLHGSTVDLTSINQPTLNVCGLRDSISQYNVAAAMTSSISNAKLLSPDTGHVGMIVSANSRDTVWRPVSKFFNDTLQNQGVG